MPKGIIISGDKNTTLLKKITSFYEATNRHTEILDNTSIAMLSPSSSSTNIYVTQSVTYDKSESLALMNYFKTNAERILVSSVPTPSLDIFFIKTVYDEYFVNIKQFNSGLMKLRFKFLFEKYNDHILNFIDQYKNSHSHQSSSLYLRVQNYGDIPSFDIIDAQTYTHTDEIYDKKIVDFSVATEYFEENSNEECLNLII